MSSQWKNPEVHDLPSDFPIAIGYGRVLCGPMGAALR